MNFMVDKCWCKPLCVGACVVVFVRGVGSSLLGSRGYLAVGACVVVFVRGICWCGTAIGQEHKVVVGAAMWQRGARRPF